MASITKIETSAVIPAAPHQVWQSLLDSRRWAHWLPEDASARIEGIEATDDTFERVGDRRRCSAILSGIPLLGARRLTWNEWVTDIDRGRTLEIEALPADHAIRRWRVRFWLVPDAGHTTRLRCHVSYRPASLTGWLADRLLLRRRVTQAATDWLNNLAASFAPDVLEQAPILEPSEALVAA
ncbi:MAG TPA: SRPBCC family protein [Chloroflexota bacterium]|nr:SRPBCC family protein [Chloroflexota bacterium]